MGVRGERQAGVAPAQSRAEDMEAGLRAQGCGAQGILGQGCQTGEGGFGQDEQEAQDSRRRT
eukprot:6424197-Pyramimonas_sp.AAC.1